MAKNESVAPSDEVKACPKPTQVPPPLMTEWLTYLDDRDTRTRKVTGTSGNNQETDTYYLFSPKTEDMYAMVPHGADPHDPNMISRINGDKYKDGKRVAYYDHGMLDGETLQLTKIDFGWNGNDPFVAKQTVVETKLEIPKPIDKSVYEAQFDATGRLINYLTGTSTGKYGFQNPEDSHYEEYVSQLHQTKCVP